MKLKNFPFIPLIMITTMVAVMVHGHRVSKETAPKVEYSMAAGVDAHLTGARNAFITGDRIVFYQEMTKASELLTKEAFCDDCIDKDIAQESLKPLLDIKHKYERESLELEDMDQVFGKIITALAKNHLIYTLEHLTDIDDEFYIEDAVRHLKFSMKYADEEIQEKEKAAAATLEEGLINHELDEEKAKKALEEVVSGI